jgi:transposase
LVRASLVPPAPIRELIDGQRHPNAIANLAHWRRPKIPALIGRFSKHHRFMTRLFLDRIDAHSADIARLDARIEAAMEPFAATRELLISIPGISRITAEVFIAETVPICVCFPARGRLASWCGLSPGSNQSAGRVKSTKTRPWNPYLKVALSIAALSVIRRKETYFWAKYRCITVRRGPMRALVSVEHAMVIAAWHILTNGEFYREPGPDYFTRARSRQDPSTRRRSTRIARPQGHPRTTYRHRLQPNTQTAQRISPLRALTASRMTLRSPPAVTFIFMSVHDADSSNENTGATRS